MRKRRRRKRDGTRSIRAERRCKFMVDENEADF
jgi:hypothetical protein